MGKIIRLTESDLTRIIKRVIKEQTSNSSDMAKYQKLYKAVNGVGTDEKLFLDTIKSIKTEDEFNRINKIALSKGEDIYSLFDGDFDDEPSFKIFCQHLANLRVPTAWGRHRDICVDHVWSYDTKYYKN